MMAGGYLLISIVLCLLPAAIFLKPFEISATAVDKARSNNSWDYFLFVEEHPAGFCYFRDGENCSYPSNASQWTMHGIWPTANGTDGPNYCNESATFNITEIESLIPTLMKEWPNLITNESFDSFWSHEWLKHGTCATGISALSTERGFFTTVLSLLEQKLNYTQALEDYGIKPSNTTTYKLDQFNDAFKKKFGVRPLVECLYTEKKGQVLSQISLCLHKDFTIMPCEPFVFTAREACWSTQVIHYIESMYS